MSKSIVIKNTELSENELIQLVEAKGGSIEIKENKKRGRPRIYESVEEYRRSCNRHLKFKNLSLEQAVKQRDKYTLLLKELNEFIDSKERQPSPMETD